MSSLAPPLPHDRDPLRPPPAPGLGRGFGVAMVAHVLLVVALSAGVSWRSDPVPALEAEIWSSVPQAAAPKEQLPPEEPPEPSKPEPRPEPPKPAEPTPQEIQAQRDAEIAIAKAKEKKQREEDAQREAEARKRKQEQDKKEQEKKEREKKEADKKEADRKEAQARKDEAAKKEKAQREADAKREAQRQENLRRIQGMAGASGGPNSTGTALKSSGPSSNYAGRIKARVRPNIIYSVPPDVANPEAEVEVRAGADGTIIARKIVKSSGLPDYDAAVLRALDRTEKLPTDTDGTVPKVMIITFRPRD